MFDNNVLKEKVEEKGISYYQLAKRVGISTGHLSNLLSGKVKNPNFDLACKIADALDVKVDDLREKKAGEES